MYLLIRFSIDFLFFRFTNKSEAGIKISPVGKIVVIITKHILLYYKTNSATIMVHF